MYNYLIVGAGIAGCVLAERLANQGNRILIVEKRNHVGGNCYDEYNQDGILIHRYGPHIFRTNSEQIWTYLSHFTDWYHYQHKANVEQIENSRDMAISLVGQELYDKFFKYYTKKQWNLWP